jgi:uncharacterized protein GlcG (DUF336 family)
MNMLLAEFSVKDAIALAREEAREETRNLVWSFINRAGSMEDFKKMMEAGFPPQKS